MGGGVAVLADQVCAYGALSGAQSGDPDGDPSGVPSGVPNGVQSGGQISGQISGQSCVQSCVPSGGQSGFQISVPSGGQMVDLVLVSARDRADRVHHNRPRQAECCREVGVGHLAMLAKNPLDVAPRGVRVVVKRGSPALPGGDLLDQVRVTWPGLAPADSAVEARLAAWGRPGPFGPTFPVGSEEVEDFGGSENDGHRVSLSKGRGTSPSTP